MVSVMESGRCEASAKGPRLRSRKRAVSLPWATTNEAPEGGYPLERGRRSYSVDRNGRNLEDEEEEEEEALRRRGCHPPYGDATNLGQSIVAGLGDAVTPLATGPAD